MKGDDPNAGDWWDQNSPPATPPDAPTPPPAGPKGPDPGQGMDAITARISEFARTHPNANPSVTRDPAYWAGRIRATHPDGNIDWGYWEGRFMQPEGPPEGAGGGGGGYGGFTTPPAVYTSNPTAPTPPPTPQWTGGNFVEPAMPAALQTPYTLPPRPGVLQTPYTLPTEAELRASPGYQARLDAATQAQQRSAAARGSVLSGGSQIELQRTGQDYASNEYGNLVGQTLGARAQNVGEYNNLVGQTLGARGQNVGEYQTTRGNLFQDYQAKYGQFLDQANLGQQSYQNRYGAYMQDNARTLTDYLTNVNTQRGFQTDYWSRLRDLRDPGVSLAGNSYKPPQ